MLQGQRSLGGDDDTIVAEVRDIHALAPPNQLPLSRRSSLGSELENFTTMSREFREMIMAGSTQQHDANNNSSNNNGDERANLGRIGEDEVEDNNPLAIVPDNHPIVSPWRAVVESVEEVSVHKVKKEEAESKIFAWQGAKIAKVNNWFKRKDVVINGWESEKVEKATALLKKVERQLDEKRARAVEKMQNDVARAHRKAEEKRASAEAKRGTKVARVLELARLMRAMGKAPSKRSFF